MESVWTVKEERREDIGHFSTRKAVRKIMIHVLPVQEVIQFGNVTIS